MEEVQTLLYNRVKGLSEADVLIYASKTRKRNRQRGNIEVYLRKGHLDPLCRPYGPCY